jgi:hypothetical protein
MSRRRPWRARHRALSALTLTLVLVLVTTACFGGGESATPTPGPEPTPAATPTGTPEPTPEPGPEVQWPAMTIARITTEDLNLRAGPGTHYLVIGRLSTGDEVPVSARSARWLALEGIGWIAYDEGWMELAMPLDDLPNISLEEAGYEFAGALHPIGARVDIPVVDEAVDPVVQGNRGALGRLAHVPGEDEPAPPTGGALCRLAAGEIEDHLDAFLTSEIAPGAPLRLYSVIRGQPPSADSEPEFLAVFAFEHGEGRAVWISGDGAGMTGFALGCEPMLPADMVQGAASGEPFFWMRPAVPEPAAPVE